MEQRLIRLGVVSFLNSRPLIEGLDATADVQLRFEVPARLPALLDEGVVDAALIPTIDILRRPGRYSVVSDACIASDGETMTVRVFSQTPPDRLKRLHVDRDSHTSVALARILWRELYGRELDLTDINAPQEVGGAEAVLLIGDKVVSPQRGSYAYEVDLGGAWRQHTGLPFVFAVWARRAAANSSGHDLETLRHTLEAARDRGVARAAEIAAECGPRHGWPVELAQRYLTRCLRFTLDERALAGVRQFATACAAAGLIENDPQRAPGLEFAH
jgi:chorismate dehydratase